MREKISPTGLKNEWLRISGRVERRIDNWHWICHKKVLKIVLTGQEKCNLYWNVSMINSALWCISENFLSNELKKIKRLNLSLNEFLSPFPHPKTHFLQLWQKPYPHSLIPNQNWFQSNPNYNDDKRSSLRNTQTRSCN